MKDTDLSQLSDKDRIDALEKRIEDIEEFLALFQLNNKPLDAMFPPGKFDRLKKNIYFDIKTQEIKEMGS